MSRVSIFAVAALCAVSSAIAYADVIVAPEVISTSPKQAALVRAHTLSIVDLGSFDEGEAVGVQIEVNNGVYKDLSAYIVDAPNMSLARQNVRFQYLAGEAKKVAPFHFMTKVSALGPHYLVLDNTYAALIDKHVVYPVASLRRLSAAQMEAVRAPLAQTYDALKQIFVFKDFNVQVKSCGQANAFSASGTGDVTLCTEIMDEMSSKPGAMGAVLLHELGHTLLNLWGQPTYSNEDVADQFAIMMLLRADSPKSRQAISEWIEWFANQDSRAQARYMLTHGDPHGLSVQRIRNIQGYLKDSGELMRRWNNVLYPNMTEQALKSIAASPGRYDSADAARRELTRRQ
jgi:hypothetical protein